MRGARCGVRGTRRGRADSPRTAFPPPSPPPHAPPPPPGTTSPPPPTPPRPPPPHPPPLPATPHRHSPSFVAPAAPVAELGHEPEAAAILVFGARRGHRRRIEAVAGVRDSAVTPRVPSGRPSATSSTR